MIGSLDIQIDASSSVQSGSSSLFKVTIKSGSSPVPNATIDVNITQGAFTISSGTSDINGEWSTTYNAPILTQPKTMTVIVTAYATQYNSVQTMMYITVTPSLKTFEVTKVELSAKSVESGSECTITVTVMQKGTNTSALKGANVTLGVLYLPTTNVVITPAQATTDASGKAVFTFKVDGVQTDTLYTIEAKVTKADWTMSSTSTNTAQVLVTAISKPGDIIPGFESVGLVAAILIAFTIVTVVLRNRRKVE
jgi:hypothetical protein